MSSRSRIVVLGAGAWGTALALALARNPSNEVHLWGRNASAIAKMQVSRRNATYLPGVEIPPNIALVERSALPCDADLVVVVVPFQTIRSALSELKSVLGEPRCVACASKGLEDGTFARADQIIAEHFPKSHFAMVSGPNFAIEVAQELPAAITIACEDDGQGEALLKIFHSPKFRPYLSNDVIGVQIGGATKNVMAIAAGIADGLNLGANSRAALITRGLAEITRFGTAQGGQIETFMGLSGLGDLVLTCTDDKSRNRRFGLALAEGAGVGAAIERIGVVEGAYTAKALVEFAARESIDMPIAREVERTIAGEASPIEAVQRLLERAPAREIDA